MKTKDEDTIVAFWTPLATDVEPRPMDPLENQRPFRLAYHLLIKQVASFGGGPNVNSRHGYAGG